MGKHRDPQKFEFLWQGKKNASASQLHKNTSVHSVIKGAFMEKLHDLEKDSRRVFFTVTTLSSTVANENWDYVGQNPVIQQIT